MNNSFNLEKINSLEGQFKRELYFLYIIKGRFLAYIKGKRKILEEGDLLIVNYMEAAMILPLTEDNMVYKFRFEDKVLGRHIFTPKNYIDKNIFRKEELKEDEVLNIINVFYYRGDLEDINLYINQLFIRIDKHIKIDESRDNKINYLKDMMEYLEGKDRLIDINLSEISEEINLNENHISKYFKDIAGVNISAFKQIRALEASSEFLLYTDESISDITYRLGYKHSKSLYDIYDKYIEMTPKGYRDRYRDFYQVEEARLVKSIIYMEFVNKYENVTFQELYEIKAPDLARIEILEKENYGNDFNGINVYSMGNFGIDYLNQIRITHREIKISRLIINLEIYEDRDYFHLKDLNIDISRKDLIELLDLLFKLDIDISLQLDLEEKYYDHILLEDFEEKYETSIMEFFTDIRRSFGIEGLFKIENIINLRYVLVPSDMDKDNVKEYLKSRLKIYKKIYGDKDIDYSLSLGPREMDDIKEILEKYKSNIDKEGPKRLYYVAIYNEASDVKDLNNVEDIYCSFNEKLNQFNEDINFLTNNKIKALPSTIVLGANFKASPDLKYFDNFIVLYIGLNMIYRMKSFSNINYIFKHNGEELPVYYSKYFDNNGFKTENFHLYSFINKMEGDIIYVDKNCIVSRTDYEYNILVYGHILLDYKFTKVNHFNISHDDFRIVELSLDGLEGDYRVTKQSLNLFNGSSKYKMKNFSMQKNLDREDYEYINFVNRPRRESKVKTIDRDYIEYVRLHPFTVVYINYRKI